MTSNNFNSNLEANYAKFLIELALLTRKYGVAIKSVGGVTLAKHDGGRLGEAQRQFDGDVAVR